MSFTFYLAFWLNIKLLLSLRKCSGLPLLLLVNLFAVLLLFSLIILASKFCLIFLGYLKLLLCFFYKRMCILLSNFISLDFLMLILRVFGSVRFIVGCVTRPDYHWWFFVSPIWSLWSLPFNIWICCENFPWSLKYKRISKILNFHYWLCFTWFRNNFAFFHLWIFF